ncbi:GMC family oxidoreductase N-terminal domain-containing protein [Streptomyces sp. TG1A-60]|uniref:GMC family oxidoreductase N-terminal domain-containing protein n=1 Tax=Streptomyces sp. TG1A-60 TaxID=3129111 RepID=UPI0030D230D0
MERRLDDPALGPDEIAAAHRVSRRHLYKLMAEEGYTVSGWLREQRLARCRRDLGDPALRHLSVGAIGGRRGFPDPAHFSLWNAPEDYACLTEPQQHADGTQVFWPRGKVLGGCSALNGMIYVRGHRSDYDDWAKRHGATGWSYDEVLPYFRRSEDLEDGPSHYHGTGGPLPVTRDRDPHPVTSAFIFHSSPATTSGCAPRPRCSPA